MIDLPDILARSDRNESVDEIARVADVSPGRIYALLRKHRPDRARKPRERTSEIPAKIRALDLQKIKPRRIAFLLDVTPAYVYKVLDNSS